MTSTEMWGYKPQQHETPSPVITTPGVPAVPTKTVSVNKSEFQPTNIIDLDTLCMSASNSHFLDEELVDPAMQPGPQEAL